METRTLSIVKHPLAVVWSAMRDRLPEIAAGVDDVESVQLEQRTNREDGALHVVHVWQANPKLPAIIAGHLRPEMLRWTDRATWSAHDFICTWRIEPHHFADRIECHGTTRYETAMGGRGTRITFLSNFLLGRGRDGAPDNPLFTAAESLLRGLIPKNFQKIVAQLGLLLDRG